MILAYFATLNRIVWLQMVYGIVKCQLQLAFIVSAYEPMDNSVHPYDTFSIFQFLMIEL